MAVNDIQQCAGVARIKAYRAVIRGRREVVTPDYAALHPVYGLES